MHSTIGGGTPPVSGGIGMEEIGSATIGGDVSPNITPSRRWERLERVAHFVSQELLKTEDAYLRGLGVALTAALSSAPPTPEVPTSGTQRSR